MNFPTPPTLAEMLRSNDQTVSLCPTIRDGVRMWQANRKNPDGSYRVEIAADPVSALMRALMSSR